MNKNLQKITGWGKHSVKGISLLAALFLLSSTAVSAQEYFYKSNENFGLDWGGQSTWQRSETVDGVYEPTNDPPTVENSKQVVISNLSEVTLNAPWSIDQLVVEGTLIIGTAGELQIIDDQVETKPDLQIDGLLTNGGLLAIDDGFGSASVEVIGKLHNLGVIEANFSETLTFTVYGTLIDDGALAEIKTDKNNLLNNPNYFSFKAGSTYEHKVPSTNQNIPWATWDKSSTTIITGLNSPGSTLGNAATLAQLFGNLIWDTPQLPNIATPFNFDALGIQGNLTIKSTGGSGSRPLRLTSGLQVDGNLLIQGSSYLRLSSGVTRTVDINGDVSVTGGILELNSGASGTTNLNVLGNFTYTGGLITKTVGSIANINFIGATNHLADISKDFTGAINFSVASGSSLDLGVPSTIITSIPGSSSFTVQGGGTVKVGDTDGINTTIGNIRIPQTYTSGSTIVFNGTASQVLGAQFPATDINVEVDNAAGVLMDKDLTIAADRTLNLKSGNLSIQDKTLTLNGNIMGSESLSASEIFASSLKIGGTGDLDTLNFTSNVIGLDSLIIDRSGATNISLSPSVIGVVGTFDLANGNFNIQDKTLGLYGSAPSGNGTIAGNSKSVVGVGVPIPDIAIGTLPTMGDINLNFNAVQNTLNSLNLGDLAQGVNLNSDLIVTETLVLKEGNLNKPGVGALILVDSSTVYLTNGVLNFEPVAETDGAYNLFYYGTAAQPLKEFTATASIRDLTIGATASATAFTLDGGRTVAGNLVLVNGSFDQENTLTVGGDFTITKGAYNQIADLTLRGNLTTSADASFTSSAATVTMAGAAPQNMAGNYTFQNLTINNNGSEVLVNNNINVDNTLTFTSGIMRTGGNRVFLGPTGSISGETDAKRLIGNIQITKTVASGDVEDFGNIGIEMAPADVDPGEIIINRNTGTPITAATGSSPSIERVFDITGPVSDQDITMTFKYLDAELNGNDETDLRMYKSTDPRQWIEQSKEQPSRYSRDATLNFVTLTGVEGFSRWTLAQPIQILPVELTSFTAKKKGKTVELNWITAMEADNKGFEVQVSADAKNYREIGFIASKNGNSRLAQKYTFTDSEKRKDGGTFYYRLRQIDNNGTEKFYGPESVSFDREALAISAHPNPTSGAVKVQYEAEANKEVNVTVIDVHGKTVFTKQVAAERGLNTLDIDLGNQANGMYFLTITSASGIQQLKLIKK